MVGRILYLKNNHIPPVETDIKSDFISFGSYDGISISKNVFSDGNDDLFKIWLQSVNDTLEMSGGYSSQAMYLFNDNDAKEDERFWEDSNFSFLFLIAVQLNKRDENLNRINEEIKKRIREYCKGLKICVNITSYLMLDENDILFAVKCNNYKLGKIITDSFHKKDNGIVILNKTFYVSYSFTIMGIKKESGRFWGCGIPDYCQIQFVEKYPGSVEEILKSKEREIIQEKELYPIFGRDDKLLRFKPKSWESILSLYKTGGVFYNDDNYRKKILSVSTRFLCKITDEEKIIFGNGNTSDETDNTKNEKTVCSQLRDKIKKAYELNSNQLLTDSYDYDNVILYNVNVCYKAIWQILNSIEKFEYKVFPDYIYVSVLAPLSMLVSKIIDNNSDLNKENIYNILLDKIEEIYVFLTAINQISQNLIRAERQFMQMPELNANCYNIPIKLHAFYAAFVDQVKFYLNNNFGTDNLYEFTLYPGINEQLNVMRIFYTTEDNKRLLLIKIPEKQIFDLNHMMICLCHEVGHFVGSKLRQRNRRYEALKKSIARLICLHLYCNENVRKYVTKNGINYLFQYMQNDIMKCIDRQKENIEDVHNNLLYMENLKPIMIYGINDYILENIVNNDVIFDVVFEEFIKEKYSFDSDLTIEKLEEDKYNYNKAMRSFFYELQSNFSANKQQITIFNLIRHLFAIAKETFADLVSILVLELDFESYCRAIFKSLSKDTINEIVNSDVLIRIVLVMNTMTKVLKDISTLKIYKQKWDPNDIDKWKMHEKNVQIITFLDYIKKYRVYAYKAYNEDDNAYERLSDVKGTSAISVFRDYILLNYLTQYLCDCRLCFEKTKSEKSENERRKIKNDFDVLTDKREFSHKIMHINDVINEYDILTRKRVQNTLNS